MSRYLLSWGYYKYFTAYLHFYNPLKELCKAYTSKHATTEVCCFVIKLFIRQDREWALLQEHHKNSTISLLWCMVHKIMYPFCVLREFKIERVFLLKQHLVMKDCNCYVQPHYTATASVKHHTELRNAMCNPSKELWDIDAFLSESVEGNL